MKIIEQYINNKKFQVFDNVLSPHLVDKWIDFYENKAKFTLSSFESKEHHDTPVYYMLPLTLEHRVGLFELDQWLEPYLTDFNSNCKLKHFNRSYIHAMTTGDKPNGHADIYDLPNDKSFYVSCVLFLNPHVTDHDNCGFYIEDFYIENKFNRLIIFDGRLFHKPVIPNSDIVRLTAYFGFYSEKERNSFARELTYPPNNQWFKRIRS